MATAPVQGDSALVIHPRTIHPAPAVMAILDRFNRDQLGNTIEVLVALLDLQDGDPDEEEDDPHGACDEDEISTNLHAKWANGPGCEISDGDSEHDGREIDDGV